MIISTSNSWTGASSDPLKAASIVWTVQLYDLLSGRSGKLIIHSVGCSTFPFPADVLYPLSNEFIVITSLPLSESTILSALVKPSFGVDSSSPESQLNLTLYVLESPL